MEPELAAAMKDAAKTLTDAFTAEETRAATHAPRYVGHYSELEDYNAGISRTVLSVQANAYGTTDADNIFLAGEYGPELVVGARGSTVFPTGETQRIIDAVSEYEHQNRWIADAAVAADKVFTTEDIRVATIAPQYLTYYNDHSIKNELLYAAREEANSAALMPQYYNELGNDADIRRMPLSIQVEASGTTYADNIFLAGECGPELVVGAGGSTVFPAEEAQRIIDAISEYELQHMSLAPLFAAFQNLNSWNADVVYAESGGSGSNGGGSSPVININYDINGVGSVTELESMLKSRDDSLIETIIEVLEDRDLDSKRRAYT